MNTEEIKELIRYTLDNKEFINHSYKMFEIREGNLVKYLEQALIEQIDAKSIRVALQRKSPINLMPKLIDKLSEVYTNGCTRISTTDADLVAAYEKSLKLNTTMTEVVRNLNTYKNFVLEIYIDEVERKVKIRPIPSYEIIPYSETNDEKVSHIIRCMGDYESVGGITTKRYWIYTDTEFVSVDSEGKIIEEDMRDNEGINPFGILPFVYASRSNYLLIPIPDYDLYCMMLLIPILYTDLNFASMFSHHGIIYTIDVNAENLKMSPDTIWNLKTELDGKTPQVNILRPETNAQNDIELLKSQMSVWLYSKNIKAGGAVGNISAENLASGFALLISELDTTKYCNELQGMFKEIEECELWNKIAVIHNYAKSNGMIDMEGVFSDAPEVIIDFPEIKILEERQTTIANIKSEIELGLLSKKKALKRLNPKMTDEQIEEQLEEVEEEKNASAESPMESDNSSGQPIFGRGAAGDSSGDQGLHNNEDAG